MKATLLDGVTVRAIYFKPLLVAVPLLPLLWPPFPLLPLLRPHFPLLWPPFCSAPAALSLSATAQSHCSVPISQCSHCSVPLSHCSVPLLCTPLPLPPLLSCCFPTACCSKHTAKTPGHMRYCRCADCSKRISYWQLLRAESDDRRGRHLSVNEQLGETMSQAACLQLHARFARCALMHRVLPAVQIHAELLAAYSF